MSPSLDTSMLHELYERKSAFPIDEDILARINPSTLGAETLQFLGMLVLWKQPRHIFEFGSGLSTLFLSRLQQRLGTTTPFPVMSIDHSQRYLGETRRALGGSSDVHLVHAPLAVTECAGRVFTTYHPAYLREIPSGVRFDFVLIDGPPAYRYGREAPLYHLAPHLTQDALIVLDDASREPEQEALANWQRTWPDGFAAMHFPELKKGLAVLQIGEPARAIPAPARGAQVATDLDRVITFLKTEGGVLADGR
jgi:predicted O-methyltransferase YrrM